MLCSLVLSMARYLIRNEHPCCGHGLFMFDKLEVDAMEQKKRGSEKLAMVCFQGQDLSGDEMQRIQGGFGNLVGQWKLAWFPRGVPAIHYLAGGGLDQLINLGHDQGRGF